MQSEEKVSKLRLFSSGYGTLCIVNARDETRSHKKVLDPFCVYRRPILIASFVL